MEMLNRCLDMTELKRTALEDFDKRNLDRKEMIAARKESRSPDFGNRKARRREAALQRQRKELV